MSDEPKLETVVYEQPIGYVTSKPVDLCNVKTGEADRQIGKGEEFSAVARIDNHTLHKSYLLTQHFFANGAELGVDVNDLILPNEQPAADPEPEDEAVSIPVGVKHNAEPEAETEPETGTVYKTGHIPTEPQPKSRLRRFFGGIIKAVKRGE